MIIKLYGNKYDLTNFSHPGGRHKFKKISNQEDFTKRFETIHPHMNKNLIEKVMKPFMVDSENKSLGHMKRITDKPSELKDQIGYAITLQIIFPLLVCISVFKYKNQIHLSRLVPYLYLQLFGIFLCHHRYFAHRAFEFKHKFFHYLFAIIACFSIQSGPINWSEIHKYHHVYCDTPFDTHTPHFEKTIFQKILYVHFLWWFKVRARIIEDTRYRSDKLLCKINKYWWLIGLSPVVFLYYKFGFFQGVVNIFMLSTFLSLNIKDMVNSIVHIDKFGKKVLDDGECHAYNVWWLSLLQLGDNNHNYHHYNSKSARHGMNGELDINYLVIKFMKKIGIVGKINDGTF